MNQNYWTPPSLTVGPQNNWGGQMPQQGSGNPFSDNKSAGGFWANFRNSGALPSIGGALGGFLGGMGDRSPYEAAQGPLSNIPGVAQQYLGPYQKQGQEAGNILQGQYGHLLNDPSGFMDWLTKNYQQSPGYQFQVNQATQAANRAAAAGGNLGSGSEQIGLADVVNNLANRDFQQYLNNQLGIYGMGLSGEQGVENQGYGASQAMNQDLMDYYATQAQLAAAQAEEKKNQDTGLGSSIGSLAGLAASFIPGIGPIAGPALSLLGGAK